MRILLSAYACEPGRGSEEEVGIRTMLAAAARHDVWLLTQERNLAGLRSFLRGRPEEFRVRLVGIPGSSGWERLNRTGRIGVYGKYDHWQRAAATAGRALHAAVDFDVVHHVTYSPYWARAGVSAVGAPFLLGPAGGGVEPPLDLLPVLGWRGLAEDLARVATRRFFASLLFGTRSVRSADCVLVQNSATSSRIPAGVPQRRLPHSTSLAIEVDGPIPRRPGEVLMIGRLIPWKAGVLAVRAMRHVQHADARLHVIGEGLERRRMERLARRLGIEQRVAFDGLLPRDALLRRLAGAGVLLHPALHDDSPLTVAEALTVGTPVVALDHGGPQEMVTWWPESPSTLVAPASPAATARALAAAVDAHLESPAADFDQVRRPVRAYATVLEQAYQSLASPATRRPS